MLRHLPAALTAGRYPHPRSWCCGLGLGTPTLVLPWKLDYWRQLGWTPL